MSRIGNCVAWEGGGVFVRVGFALLAHVDGDGIGCLCAV